MPVSHVRAAAMASTDEQAGDEIPGLLEVLARVPDPRRNRGRRYRLVFMLTVTVACVLAGAAHPQRRRADPLVISAQARPPGDSPEETSNAS